MTKKINKKLLLIILGSIFVGIVLAVLTNQGVSALSQNSFCVDCHDAPEFMNHYAGTPHANVDCLSCHSKGFVKDKVVGVKKVLYTVTGQYDPNNYIEITGDVKEGKCLNCHNLENEHRDKTSARAHEIYEKNDLTCLQCHDEVYMHGKLRDFSEDKLKDSALKTGN